MGVNKLTLKDKLHLNRRARAHGLPDLWPEAEKYAEEMRHAWSDATAERMILEGLAGPRAAYSPYLPPWLRFWP